MVALEYVQRRERRQHKGVEGASLGTLDGSAGTVERTVLGMTLGNC